MKQTIAHIFNYASMPLYALNEGLQKLHGQGIPVYDSVPGGDYVRNYMSSFFGAYACAWVLHRVSRHQTDRSVQNAVAITAPALALWECVHRSGANGSLDWKDIGFYAVALPLFYALNKKPASAAVPQAAPRVS